MELWNRLCPYPSLPFFFSIFNFPSLLLFWLSLGCSLRSALIVLWNSDNGWWVLSCISHVTQPPSCFSSRCERGFSLFVLSFCASPWIEMWTRVCVCREDASVRLFTLPCLCAAVRTPAVLVPRLSLLPSISANAREVVLLSTHTHTHTHTTTHTHTPPSCVYSGYSSHYSVIAFSSQRAFIQSGSFMMCDLWIYI